MRSDISDLVTDAMRACIGSVTETVALPDNISASDVRHFCAVVGETNPIYRDEAYAKKMGYERCVVPPMLVTVLFRRIDDPSGRIGLDFPGFELPPAYTNSRNAGQTYVFVRPVYVDERLSVRVKLADVFAKVGKSGIPLIYVIRQTEMFNQDGELVEYETSYDAKLPEPQVPLGA